MTSSVKVYDKISKETLFECSFEEIDKAYKYANQMEEIGLDVGISAPSLPETLATELGASEEEIETLKESILEEIDSHNNCEPCSERP